MKGQRLPEGTRYFAAYSRINSHKRINSGQLWAWEPETRRSYWVLEKNGLVDRDSTYTILSHAFRLEELLTLPPLWVVEGL